MSQPIHSTGRGGAGNIGEDPNIYTDAGTVREGVAGQSADGEFSTGRGGAGNMLGDGKKPIGHRTDDVYVPEPNTRPHQEDFHTGRGGGGNVHKDKYGGHSTKAEQEASEVRKESVADKVKHALGMDKK